MSQVTSPHSDSSDSLPDPSEQHDLSPADTAEFEIDEAEASVEEAPPDRISGLDRLRSNPPSIESVVSLLIVAASSIFVLVEMHPGLLIDDTLPTGGDMGAHVWGPAYLRDELLPSLRLSGWTPDWYAGFPAFQFYMVLPALAIVALNVGLPLYLGLPFLAALGVLVTVVDRRALVSGRWTHLFTALIALLAVLAIGIPYGVAFKLIAVSGLVSMPISAWALGRMSAMPFPIPPLLAVATLPFIFDRSFNIYGGNAASTMAGEFAFSISLSLCLLFLGFFQRALDTGKGRGWAAVTFALTLLCHLLPAIFAVGVAAIMLTLRVGRRQTLNAVAIGLCGTALSSFWLLPFLLRREYLNDMGWEKLTTYSNYLFSRDNLNPSDVLRNSPPFQLVFIIALVGLVLAIVTRTRLGLVFAMASGATALLFRFMPQGRIWNARMLPFYYLSVYLLAGIAVALAVRLVANALTANNLMERLALRTDIGIDYVRRAVSAAGAALSFLVIFVALGLPLAALPGGGRDASGVYSWGPLETTDSSYVPGWSKWNFSGYQAKSGDASGGGWAEFSQLMTDMGTVGAQQGCGRAFWEFSSDLNRYGTTMAPMLLPHFTDGCIGSMEGLYFESSASVPYHFLIQSELGEKNSRAQRELPYREFDITAGVEHLQLYGVKYYLAFSDLALNAARAHPDLTELAASGPWVAFSVAGSELVEPLNFQPAVLDGVAVKQDEWLDVGVEFFQNQSQDDVFLTADGPSAWQRVTVTEIEVPPVAEGETAPPRKVGGVAPTVEPTRIDVPSATVTNIESNTNTISFSVDQIGTPVLVKTSYFPNWKVSGAEGPYRVTPNLMVVVPTSTDVKLSYGYTWVEAVAWSATILGAIGLYVLSRRDDRPDEPRFDPVATWLVSPSYESGYRDALAQLEAEQVEDLSLDDS